MKDVAKRRKRGFAIGESDEIRKDEIRKNEERREAKDMEKRVNKVTPSSTSSTKSFLYISHASFVCCLIDKCACGFGLLANLFVSLHTLTRTLSCDTDRPEQCCRRLLPLFLHRLHLQVSSPVRLYHLSSSRCQAKQTHTVPRTQHLFLLRKRVTLLSRGILHLSYTATRS